MARPITLFTGQWADLPFEEVCRLASGWGYEGLEIACWGDHLDVVRAAEDDDYLKDRRDLLERHGVLRRSVKGRGVTYELTEMGQALRAVLDAMGQWGAHWLEIEPHHLDPAYVLWATMKLVDLDRIPEGTTMVRFELRDRPSDTHWMILRRPQPELCTRPSGYDEDLVCRTDSATLVDLHLKRLDYPAAVRTGRVELIGPPGLTRQFRTWFRTSPFADFLG